MEINDLNTENSSKPKLDINPEYTKLEKQFENKKNPNYKGVWRPR